MAFISTPLVYRGSSFTPTVIGTSGASRHNHNAVPKLPLRARPQPMRFPIRATRDDRTFIAVKPDGMNRALLGNIISRFESKGYTLVGIKTLIPSRSLAEEHYAALSEKPFFKDLVDFITSGPVCAMVWQGEGVVATARSMIGATNPLGSSPGTIRGDFGIDIGRKYVLF